MGCGFTNIVIDPNDSWTAVGVHDYDRDNGGSLLPPRGTAFPTSPATGEIFLREDQNQLYRWDGAAWQVLGGADDQTAAEVPATPPTFLSGTDVQAIIDELDIRGRSIKITNTDTTTNLTSTVAQAFDELLGATDWNDDATIFSPSLGAGQVTINRTGRYRAEFACDFIGGTGSNAARDNIRVWFTLGGVQVGPNFQSNYLRDGTGHNEVSQNGFVEFDATAGQVLQVNRQRVAGAGGTVTLQTTEGFLQVTVVR